MLIKFKEFYRHKILRVLRLNAVSVVLGMVTGIFSSKIIALYLGPQGMVWLGSFRNFSSLLKSVTGLGISNGVVKHVVEHQKREQPLGGLYATFFWSYLLFSVVLAIGVYAANPLISRYIFFYSNDNPAISLFALALPFIVVNTFLIAVYNGFETYKKIILIQLFSTLLVFLTAALCIVKYGLQGGLNAFALGEIGSTIVTLIFAVYDAPKMNLFKNWKWDPSYFRSIFTFSGMALWSAVLAPLTLVIIRNEMVAVQGIEAAGVWDGLNRLSGFYMVFLSSGLTLYFVPRLASLETDRELRAEVITYYQIMVPIFVAIASVLFLFKEWFVRVAFTAAFSEINTMLIWQLLGDFFKILTLAFGFQTVVKTQVLRYFIIETFFNALYLILALNWMNSSVGVVQAYALAAGGSFVLVLVLFRKQIRTATSG